LRDVGTAEQGQRRQMRPSTGSPLPNLVIDFSLMSGEMVPSLGREMGEKRDSQRGSA